MAATGRSLAGVLVPRGAVGARPLQDTEVLELLRNEMALPGSFLPDSFGRNTGELEKFYVDAHDLARAESVSFALTPNCMGVRFPDGLRG